MMSGANSVISLIFYTTLAFSFSSIGDVSKAMRFADRDNDLVVADDNVGRSMVLIVTDNSKGSGTQVCPGVFMTNAHVAYAGDSNGPLRQNASVVPYSFEEGKEFRRNGLDLSELEIVNSKSYQSGVGGLIGTDYAFLKAAPAEVDRVFAKLGSEVRSNDFVPLLRLDGTLLSSLSDAGDIDVHLYRFGYSSQDNGRASLPRRTAQACRVAPVNDHNFGFDCPIQGGVSGSSLVSHIHGQPFVVGLIWGGSRGANAVGDTFRQSIGRHIAMETSSPCEDYEEACGRPCIEPSGILETNIEHDRDAVSDLQSFLNANGFDAGPVDGLYSGRTGAALDEWLATTDLETDGFTIAVRRLISNLSE